MDDTDTQWDSAQGDRAEYAIEPELLGPLPREVPSYNPKTLRRTLATFAIFLAILLPVGNSLIWLLATPSMRLGEAAVFSLALLAATGFVVAMILAMISSRVRLARWGRPVAGTITDKCEEDVATSGEYVLRYAFPLAYASKTVDGLAWVTKAQWNSVHVGDVFTILYLPNAPGVNCIYRFSSAKPR